MNQIRIRLWKVVCFQVFLDKGQEPVRIFIAWINESTSSRHRYHERMVSGLQHGAFLISKKGLLRAIKSEINDRLFYTSPTHHAFTFFLVVTISTSPAGAPYHKCRRSKLLPQHPFDSLKNPPPGLLGQPREIISPSPEEAPLLLVRELFLGDEEEDTSVSRHFISGYREWAFLFAFSFLRTSSFSLACLGLGRGALSGTS
ncbi:hypothetical protein HAX54_034702 [Datura stramonium]|uniref:Uncharacterized protein n=1 Tax=Datura stramonium TaxID=4076 RepID=A0ABS8SFC9_DATST|nr:hypothetical protein [Datura stramonium]